MTGSVHLNSVLEIIKHKEVVGRVVTGQTVCVLFKDGRNLERVSIAFVIKKKTKKKRTPRQKTNSIK